MKKSERVCNIKHFSCKNFCNFCQSAQTVLEQISIFMNISYTRKFLYFPKCGKIKWFPIVRYIFNLTSLDKIYNYEN